MSCPESDTFYDLQSSFRAQRLYSTYRDSRPSFQSDYELHMYCLWLAWVARLATFYNNYSDSLLQGSY
jgi:hypothetical protein